MSTGLLGPPFPIAFLPALDQMWRGLGMCCGHSLDSDPVGFFWGGGWGVEGPSMYLVLVLSYGGGKP